MATWAASSSSGGERQSLSQLRVDAEFERLTTRATLLVEGIGIIGASLGDGLAQSMSMFQEELEGIG